ncbi:hypothetical protein B0A49_04895, partial [Cryomyces minteri]
VDTIDWGDYFDSIPSFANIVNRSPVAEAARSDCRGFHTFGHFQTVDNWHHVRKLITALESHLSYTARPNDAHKAETDLRMLLAAIHHGAAGPLPWILVVDAMLCKVWRRRIRKSSPSALLTELFDELVLFLHGTARNAIAGRYPSGGFPKAPLAKEWHNKIEN